TLLGRTEPIWLDPEPAERSRLPIQPALRPPEDGVGAQDSPRTNSSPSDTSVARGSRPGRAAQLSPVRRGNAPQTRRRDRAVRDPGELTAPMTRAKPASGAALLRRTAPAAALALAVCIAVVGSVRFFPATLVLFLAAAGVLLAAGTGLSLPRAPDAPEAPTAGRRALLGALVGSLIGGALLLAALRRFAASENVSRGGWGLFLLAL